MAERLANKVLLIGWDAGDWKHIRPLLEAGQMPTLQRFLEQGVHGNLATLQPILSPMLWTSIGTGKRPHKHGIHGFIEPMPDGKGVRPSTSTTRTCKAVWNILTQSGLKTHAVGWFCSHPAEPIDGVCVSNLYHRVPPAGKGLSPLPEGTVHPVSMADTLAELRLDPRELTAAHLLPFIPRAAEIDQGKDPRLGTLAKLLAECINTHTAATYIMEHRPWDFMTVYYDSVDHFCHGFMQYHPPRMDGVREKDFAIYKDVVAGCYRFHDMMLDRLLQLAGDDTTVILCSDHGFHSDHLRPRSIPLQPAGPAVWHRPYGILAMKGPPIKKEDRIWGATLLDVTPTILNLFGLPVGRDMDGKPLVQALDRERTVEYIDSWEDVAGSAGMHPGDLREDPFEARLAVQQLVDLGYIEEPNENQEIAAARAAREAQYNLARAYIDGGRADQAAELLQQLLDDEPEESRFALNLARCRLAQRKLPEARRIVQRLLDTSQQKAHRHADALQQKRLELQERQPREPTKQDGPAGARQPDPRKLDPQQPDPRKLDQAIRHLRDFDVQVLPKAKLLMGILEYFDHRYEAALECLLEAERTAPRQLGLHNQLGRVYLRLKRWDDAKRAFRRTLEIDGDNAQAYDGLAVTLLRLRKPTAAADHALRAVGLLHFFPRAHYHLGVAMARMGWSERAIEAFEVALSMSPRMGHAHRWLARLYNHRLHNPEKARHHADRFEQLTRRRVSRNL